MNQIRDLARFSTSHLFVIITVLVTASFASAQSGKLPQSETIINQYIKAAGGKKRLAAIKNTEYIWKITHAAPGKIEHPNVAKGKTQYQSPGQLRFDLPHQNSEDPNRTASKVVATNGSASWTFSGDELQTLPDDISKALRLQASLVSTRLTDLKAQRITVSLIDRQTVRGTAAYVVEFGVRDGSKVNYYFGVESKLPVKIENPTTGYSACLSDYRANDRGILEAHRIIEPCSNDDQDLSFYSYELEKVTYDSRLDLATFEPPLTLENFDLTTLISELTQNEESMLDRISEYSFIQKETERTFDGKGSVKKETSKTFEVFPTREGRRILKLIEENDVPLTSERLSKEEQRVVKELEKSEAVYTKRQARSTGDKKPEARAGAEMTASEGGLEQQAILTILRVSEVYAPRFETFRDRKTIVFNFRPRAGYKPRDFFDAVFSKLAGTVWVDATDKQIVRAETRVTENVKMGGGLLATFRKDSTIVFERAKFGDVWLPRSSHDNASAKILLFGGLESATVTEYSNYNRYTTEVENYKTTEIDKAKP